MMKGFTEEQLTGATKGEFFYDVKTNYDSGWSYKLRRLIRRSSVETMSIDGPEGPGTLG